MTNDEALATFSRPALIGHWKLVIDHLVVLPVRDLAEWFAC
jgi:hypothetical protein